MKMPPCKNCNWWLGRSVDPNCHDTCERYLAWRKQNYKRHHHHEIIDEYITEMLKKRKVGGQR